MGNIIDITGQRFGRLVALKKDDSKPYKNAHWICQCDCGNTTSSVSHALRSGKTKSCGCIGVESRTKHGMRNSREYETWYAMKKRCYNPNADNFKHYGGRGITVCDEWKDSFEAFYKDMGERPEGATLDRIDPTGNYEPSNCRWATSIEQARNRRNNHFLTFLGETEPVVYFSRKYNIPYRTLMTRLRIGWSVEDSLTKPVQRR